MTHRLMLWLYGDAPKSRKSFVVILTIRGHSDLSADRVCEQNVKVTRTYNTIKSPTNYYNMYSNKGETRKFGTDWIVFDIKTTLNSLKKVEGIRVGKRIIIKRARNNTGVLLKTELFYRNDDPTKQFELPTVQQTSESFKIFSRTIRGTLG